MEVSLFCNFTEIYMVYSAFRDRNSVFFMYEYIEQVVVGTVTVLQPSDIQ